MLRARRSGRRREMGKWRRRECVDVHQTNFLPPGLCLMSTVMAASQEKSLPSPCTLLRRQRKVSLSLTLCLRGWHLLTVYPPSLPPSLSPSLRPSLYIIRSIVFPYTMYMYVEFNSLSKFGGRIEFVNAAQIIFPPR